MRKSGLKIGLLAGAAVLALAGFEYGPALAGSSTAASGSSHAAPSSHAAASQTAAKPSDDTAHGQSGASAGSHWGYQGTAGPANWGRISKDYHLCADGTEQSPIDMAGSFDGATLSGIAFDYRLSPVKFTNNGHTVQVNYAPGSAISVRGERFELLQFHFHTPSEHAIAGRQAPMEVHLVHKSAKGALAVVGVMIEEGAENLALSEFWSLMPRQAGETKQDRRTLINARDLLPAGQGYYRYMGSLTTPPCSEGVHWHVMAEPVTASAEQIKQIVAVMGANARPVQPTGQRLVLAPMAGH